MTTFGDLMAVADKHLATLNNALYRPDVKEAAKHPGVLAELTRCANVLSRYSGKIADGFGTTAALDERVRRVARQSFGLISQAQTRLGAAPANEPYGPPLSWTLRATSQTLGCGLDLLASHFPVTPPGGSPPLRGNAAVIAATDTARALLHKLSPYAAATGHLAMAAGPAGHEAGAMLLQAALLEGLHGDASPSALTAVGLRLTQDRIPPNPAESLDQALQGLTISAERLRAADVASSVATSRYLSMAAAIGCELTELLSRQLGRRLHDLDHPEPATQLITPTAGTLNTLRGKWRAIARAWNELSRQQGTPSAALAVDASDLVTRLGRLVYDDPAWKPGPRSTRRVLPASTLAPTTEDVTRIGLAAMKTLEAWNMIAESHRSAMNDLAILSGLQSRPRTTANHELRAAHASTSSAPLRPSARIRGLLDRHKSAHAHGCVAISRFGAALIAVSPAGSVVSAETELILRRTAAAPTPDPVAQGAADFPTPIAQALKPEPESAPETPHAEPAKRPTQAPPASLRTIRPRTP